MCVLWVRRSDLNRRSPGYGPGELTSSLPRNGCTRRIWTSSLGYEPSELPLLHQCYIKGSLQTYPRSTHKERKWKWNGRTNPLAKRRAILSVLVSNRYWGEHSLWLFGMSATNRRFWYQRLDSNQLSPGYESGAYPHKLLWHIKTHKKELSDLNRLHFV